MYAAIFSDKDLYECQVKRLMKRTNLLLDIYGAKASLGNLDCSKNLVIDLVNGSTSFKSSIESYSSSQDLVSFSTQVNLIQRKNKNLRCKLW
jgi:hypothetical protein